MIAPIESTDCSLASATFTEVCRCSLFAARADWYYDTGAGFGAANPRLRTLVNPSKAAYAIGTLIGSFCAHKRRNRRRRHAVALASRSQL